MDDHVYEMKFTDVRNNFRSVIDRVQNLSPVVVKPRKNSETYTFLLSKEWVKQLLQEVKIKVNMYPEEDGSITLGIDELELYANGDTKEKAFEELTEDLIQYAQDYMNELTAITMPQSVATIYRIFSRSC